jgi:cytochrome P450
VQHGFFAVSRFEDVNRRGRRPRDLQLGPRRGAGNHQVRYGSARHTDFRGSADPQHPPQNLLSRMFTSRKIMALEPRIREFTARCLDPLVGTGRFDFIKDLGALMPMRVIGMLLGIPEADQQHVIDYGDATLRTGRGRPMTENPNGPIATGEVFAEFIDLRTKHPSDDIMTELLTVDSRTKPEPGAD